MATTKTGKAAETLKKPAKWSAKSFGEGGYEVVPPEKEEEFRKRDEEENRRRPGMYAGRKSPSRCPRAGYPCPICYTIRPA